MQAARRRHEGAFGTAFMLAAVAFGVSLAERLSWLLTMALCGAAVSGAVSWACGRKVRSLARELASAESPLAVAELVDVLQREDLLEPRWASLESMRMLAGSVRVMRADDAAHLTDEEAAGLYAFLNISRAEETGLLQLAILSTLDSTRDTRALEPIRRIAGAVYGRPHTGAVIRVKEAAQRVLPLLEAQKRIEDQAGTLVRPADADQSGALLQPVTAANSGTESLLRSVSQAEDS